MQPSAALSASTHRLASSDARLVSVVPERPALGRLRRQIDDAFDAAEGAADPSHHTEFAGRMRAALADASASPSWLTDTERESDPRQYRRHLLAADPLGRYAIVVLVWRAGQLSPVHGHQTWCGYTVLEGMLTETRYDWNADTELATETRRHSRGQGTVSFVRAGTHAIHRFGNNAGSCHDAPAVSLHVYGVPGERIATHVNTLVRVAAPACA